MSRTPIRVVREPDLTRIVLDVPERQNRLSEGLVDALIAALEAESQESQARLVIESSEAVFCAGFDLSGLADATHEKLVWRFLRIGYLLELLYSYPGVTVAVARGPAIGAGADIFAACDLRVASDSAHFRFPGARFGVTLGTGRLTSLVGAATALEWISQVPRIDCDWAFRAGLVSHVREIPQTSANPSGLDLVPAIDPRQARQLSRIVGRPDPGDGLGDLAWSLAVARDLKARLMNYADGVLAKERA